MMTTFKLLISLTLIYTTQNPIISAFSTHRVDEVTTESSTDATEQNVDATTEKTDVKLKLVKDLIAENSNADVFKDLVNVPDQELAIEVISCFVGACMFRVTHINKSFVIEQHNYKAEDAEKTAKVLQLEYKAMEQRNQLQPGIVPQPYLLSLQYNCIVMEDFKDYVYLKSLLASGEISEEAINNILVSVAALHNMTFGKVDTLGQDFRSNELADLVLKAKYVSIFNNATVEKLTNAGVSLTSMDKLGSQELIDKVSQIYANISSTQQAVIHGFPTGDNIIVNVGNVKLLGNQFAFVGPVSYDVGVLEAQYLTTYYVSKLTAEDNDAKLQISYKMINASNSLIDGYTTKMGTTVFDTEKIKEFVSDVAGIAGVELVCWVMTDPNMFSPAASAIFEAGLRLIEESHNINSTASLVNIALNGTS